MKDAIDKKNEREKIARSIIKRRNVVYITREEAERRRQAQAEGAIRNQVSSAEREIADDILRRLELEAAEDEAKRQQEIEEARRISESGFQQTTPHESYGTNPMDMVTQEKVSVILSDKERQIEEIIRSNEENKKLQALVEGASEDSPADSPQPAADSVQEVQHMAAMPQVMTEN